MMIQFSRKLFIATFILFLPSLAFAHAHLIKAEPAEKSVAKEIPTQIVLKFSEELESSLCRIEVKDAVTGKVVSTGNTEIVDGTQDTIQTKLNAAAKTSKLKVSWKVVSKDAHKMKGDYEFSIDANGK